MSLLMPYKMDGTNNGQSSAKKTKAGQSFQLKKRSHAYCEVVLLRCKTTQLKVVNLAKTTFRFSPVRYRAKTSLCMAVLCGPNSSSLTSYRNSSMCVNVSDKRASLLRLVNNYDRKKFYRYGQKESLK
jgi:hypothetical protein